MQVKIPCIPLPEDVPELLLLDLKNIHTESEHPNSLRFPDAFEPGLTGPALYQDRPFLLLEGKRVQDDFRGIQFWNKEPSFPL